MLLLCIKIFFARIVDVTFGTIRTVLVVRGRRFTPAIIAFFEVLIWFLVAREALTTDIKSIIIPICYAGGYATGTFIGGYISNNLVEGLIGVQVTTKTSDVKKMIKEIRDAGFGELFRSLSYEEIGPRAMFSRAVAGCLKQTAIYALPGSTNAVKLGMSKLIIPTVQHFIGELHR